MIEIPDLYSELRRLLRQLPDGKVATFGVLARALGHVGAAKWIANWLSEQPHTVELPAARVVRADGSLGNYQARSTAQQAELLQKDGIHVEDYRVDLKVCEFQDFQGTSPLTTLEAWQINSARQVTFECAPHIWIREPESDIVPPTPEVSPGLAVVGGLDVSYVSSTKAVAALAAVETTTRNLLWTRTHVGEIQFPYISGFLAFRELPLLIPLVSELRAEGILPNVLIVDGQGTLHPRGMGIAAHLGVATATTTIGVGKTLPCGTVDLEDIQPGEIRPITYQQRLVGNALRSFTTKQLLYISPGNEIDLTTATTLVRWLAWIHRLPTPQFWADRLSRERARELMPEKKTDTPSEVPEPDEPL